MTLLALAACGGTAEIDGEGELMGDAEGALQGDNALNPNALNPNALNPNALSPVALASGFTSQEVLSALQGDEGALSRQLLRYVVRCALKDTQSISFSWSDDAGVQHQETYTGSLGLAHTWAWSPLSGAESRRWVSACLAALVNYYGSTVIVSLRGSHERLNAPSQDELAQYDVMEGAFWGDLFSDTPYVRACYHAASVDHARSQQRDCAAGHIVTDPDTGDTEVEPCGTLQIVGPCDTRCGAPLAAGYFSGCSEDPGGSPEGQVITTWLQ